jgi:hypothetical protein
VQPEVTYESGNTLLQAPKRSVYFEARTEDEMSATDQLVTEMLKKVAKLTGKSEADLRAEFSKDKAAFGDKYYEHMTPEEMALFG